jgi:hypothetical protein
MTKNRQFNAARFFDAFQSHEEELAGLLSRHSVPVPDPMTTAAVCQAVRDGGCESLTSLLHQLNDLVSEKGREIVATVATDFGLADVPGDDVPDARAAMWLWRTDQDAFESAMDRLAAAGIQGGKISMFPGREARPVDAVTAVAGFQAELARQLSGQSGTTAFTVRHYQDGDSLVLLVFRQRTAEVAWDLQSGVVVTKIRRPVVQDVVFYHPATGELEIEAGRPNNREVLRSAFAVGAMGDDEFFPLEEQTRVLNLQRLRERGFILHTRPGHTATITGLTLKIPVGGKQITANLAINRLNLIDALSGIGGHGLLSNAIIRRVRIELTLGTGRLDRKSIELSAPNGIKFNRASHVDAIYDYLRHWNILEQGHVAGQSAA